MPNNFRTNRATLPRVAAIAAVAMATLFVSVLPASGTASASVGTDQAPRQITAEPRPGARSVTLSPRSAGSCSRRRPRQASPPPVR